MVFLFLRDLKWAPSEKEKKILTRYVSHLNNEQIPGRWFTVVFIVLVGTSPILLYFPPIRGISFQTTSFLEISNTPQLLWFLWNTFIIEQNKLIDPNCQTNSAETIKL